MTDEEIKAYLQWLGTDEVSKILSLATGIASEDILAVAENYRPAIGRSAIVEVIEARKAVTNAWKAILAPKS